MAHGLSSGARGFNVFVAPMLTSLAWFSPGAGLVEITAPTEVELRHREDDPRPRQALRIGSREVDAVVDLTGTHSRIGRLWAVRLGLDTQRRKGTEVATLPEVRFGEVVLHDLRVEVVADDDVFLAAQALPELAVAVRHSQGRVAWVRAGEGEALIDGLGSRQTQPAAWSTAREVGQAPGALVLDGGQPRVWTTPTVGAQELSPSWVEPGPEAVVGARELVELDLAVWPAGGAWAAAPEGVPWVDEVVARRDRVEAEAASWEVPPPYEAEASELQGDPGSGWRSDRWRRLAHARWAAGDAEGAVEAATAAVGWGADRCLPWVELGELLLRTGQRPSGMVRGLALRPVDVLVHARGLLAAWEEPAPDHRGEGFGVRQPESCRRVHGVVAEALLSAGRHDELAALEHPAAAPAQAVQLLREGAADAAVARLLNATADRPGVDAVREVWLAIARVRAGGDAGGAARAAVCGGTREGLALAALRAGLAAELSPADNGRSLLASCVTASPAADWIRHLHGDPTPDLAWAYDVARRPLRSESLAQLILARGVFGDGPPLTVPPTADAAWGHLLVAATRLRTDDADVALDHLAARWPLFSPWK